MKSYDIVVVGAGIIGLNIAFQCARRSGQRVLVLERGAAVGEGSTGASSAVCRHRYSTNELSTLARDGIVAYRHWQDYLQLSGTRAEFQNDGVLWMPCEDTGWAQTEQKRMAALNINAEVLDADETRRRFPALSTCTRAPDFESGASHPCDHGGVNLFECDGGYMDPVSAAQDLVDACRQRGVEFLFATELTAVDSSGDVIRSIETTRAGRIATDTLINAAGPWCNRVNAAAGYRPHWNLAPTRIQVLHRDRPDTLRGTIPITVDMAGGIYFRTQNRGQQLLVSSVLEEDEQERVANPDDFFRGTDTDFEALKMHALHHRLPGLDHHARISGYSGLYTVNTHDVHPVLGPTEIGGYWLANGFSGHGFKLAPAIGAMLAGALLGDGGNYDTEVPIDFLSTAREPIRLDVMSVLA